jgi:hypothetical protein
MEVLKVRNVHAALPIALDLLFSKGMARYSRNGPVLQMPWPVATVYTSPTERVLFWPERDANPFFHLYESLWMLAGRNDVAGPVKYVKTFGQFSDDGRVFHGAYGFRWRNHFTNDAGCMDQLTIIIRRLRKDPTDRRCVLAMHDAAMDLDVQTKDQPCNLTITFQISVAGQLDMVVFNRSNDIVWGCYGANAVHFSMLQEYMARRIGVEVGTYTQVSVNWHGYHATIEPLRGLHDVLGLGNPYDRDVVVVPMPADGLDEAIHRLLDFADHERDWSISLVEEPWTRTVAGVLFAHQMYRHISGIERFQAAFSVLDECPVQNADWVVAARQWLTKREMKVHHG